MVGASIGRGAMRIINAMVQGIVAAKIHPNILTATGVIINVGCGILFGVGEFFWAGVVLIGANLFDMLDGSVARVTGNVTRFGAFLDSSLDRLSDMVIFSGIIFFYASNTAQRSLLNAFLALVAMMGSVMVSYTTARAEAVGVKANVGFLQRPERIVLLILGALSTHWESDNFFANRMPQVLWILAIGSFWTFIHRMYFTWIKLKQEK
ncbi:MAG: CDP-alcohol phosphatidyltransferase family protein [Pyrinomonadaceae bacterium]|nr:CDP-alcohol phosphatidyltransferase family protein [Pyrinomonadaceae bacterium]MCX7640379.1 CDP-alcohol phosphatidyltransferase family protein [Pyrinomonadaceae bacterium]MDW8304807.1 CDP-alcohol phosphatidyltransferase family protein [Acidobacteriota bacterium]